MAKQKNVNRPAPRRPVPALSDLSVTEFLTLARLGFYPHGLVIGVAVYDAGFTFGLTNMTVEMPQIGNAMRSARALAVKRMRDQADQLGAEGVVGVRLQVEHHKWHGGHVVAKIVAIGTAVGFDAQHAHPDLQHSPSLRLRGRPFTSDLSGQDFVTLLRAGYRPISIALGNCVYEISKTALGFWATRNQNVEISEYTVAFMNARETAMQNLERDLHQEFPKGDADAPVGVVGMTVTEEAHAGAENVVEYTAVGTAIGRLRPEDPRRAAELPAPTIVMPVD